MKKDQLSTLIAVGFFAGTFVIAFTSNDSDTAAMRVLAYLAIGCLLSLVAIFWDRIIGSSESKPPATPSASNKEAESFTARFNDMYVSPDSRKNQRTLHDDTSVTGSPI
ncbi:hypothetical protein ACD591_17070 [Rufibacter glacialis]|uniref:Uncharacterized protein n=1 Tax=Rufibacter glacialis TaxID=1259555 RepID=A0A5M8QHN4_9BACT|nr:hypothetical protein [Rufibacter glacialis]KAA6434296.1 hypothetical protein FOE74_08805 [Rufibacter glacialis]GGK68372.1 hypothetical protein GCM10011405_15550 [Rufibacter glacialis]